MKTLYLFSLIYLIIWIPTNAQTLVRRKTSNAHSPTELAAIEMREGDKYFDMKGGALKIALEHYLHAYTVNSEVPLLNYRIGVCYLNTINRVRSIPYLEKAERLMPDVSRDIHFLLGIAYQLNMEWDKAIAEYELYKTGTAPELAAAMAPEINKRIAECNTGEILVAHPVHVSIENLGAVVNSPFPEYGPFVTADESTLYFTARRDNTLGGLMDDFDNEFYEDIYVTQKENGKWTAPKNLDIPINTDFHDAIAGLSADGHRMFVYRGDVNGGDIFESRLNGYEWTKPVNMGKPINSKYHETSACLSNDEKTLYFVSDKPEGSYGGKDIYKSELQKNGKWGEPVNLGPVINTQYDEDGVFLHADGKTLYFGSKGHETMGGYDIFKSVWNDSAQTWSKPENIGYPINTPDDDVFFVMSASGKHGYYASVKTGGYGEKDIYMIDFSGETSAGGNLIASTGSMASEPPCIIVANLTLLKGLVQDAETGKPVLASVEIVDNAKNKTISTFESNAGTGKYLISLPSGKNYGIVVKANGYLFHSENFDIPSMQDYQEVTKDILLDKLEVGKKMVLNNIFYDFDKATLRSASIAELERLVALLNEKPSLKVEIASHTDNRGAPVYNQTLSEARAKAVVDYLVEHGIKKSRLEFKGYGMTDPVANNESSDGRQLNRRTEFKIVGK